mmetsp:Transcript_97191/g.253258  ORF Transcript_97191/g.253258 Transcript_97191/m.253258 type:complete len:217 (-) Transcript_97191:479-1129(-)
MTGPRSVSGSIGSPSCSAETLAASFSRNSAKISRCTSTRLPLTHVCPEATNAAKHTPFTASSMERVSAKTTTGALPPSSAQYARTRPASVIVRWTLRPVATPPVKSTRSTSGFRARALPATGPVPGSTWTVPGGNPASPRISPSRSTVSGASKGGFTTTQLPAASATATFFVAISKGWFQGVMRPQTPMGTRQTRFTCSAPSTSGGSRPSKPWAAA